MNKVCMKTIFAIIALFAYVRNEVLEGTVVPREVFLTEGVKNPIIYDSDEIYEQNKHLFCTDSEEEDQVEEIMEDARRIFLRYIKDHFGFKFYDKHDKYTSSYFMKYKDGTCIGKSHTIIPSARRYNEIVKTLWDPNGEKKYNPDFVSGKVVRAYNRDLLMIQQRYKNDVLRCDNYYYAFAAKYEISNKTTIILKASGNINDHNKHRNKNRNALIKSANAFEFDIDSDEDIAAGKLNNMVVNLSGYIITKKKKSVLITHIDSVDGNIPVASDWYRLVNKSNRLGVIADLKHYMDEKYSYTPRVGAAGYGF
ncbi:fam-a protein [Plasmodium chabaudi chabaudi]|uniref:Fam-a protein n=1 Tax=Plasmodium chabaudi chabaudi TaxID=31271 RepID=A0A4V0K2A8_PLACU|nr:fam-a protein [Plasmodium chabaudi chabaudi]VTZ66944.1 fam-a protein [Plasmodium chabaudi chabaudi]|eukprot:XP_016653148.1 fam-a protein [Plasmodium chabaudi chabaudi]